MEVILTLLHTPLDELVVGDPSVGRSEASLELIPALIEASNGVLVGSLE